MALRQDKLGALAVTRAVIVELELLELAIEAMGP